VNDRRQPAPERGRRTSWTTFLRSHFGAIAGADFFTVEVVKPFGLVRYFVFFPVDISRRANIAGITDRPSEAWMKQMVRWSAISRTLSTASSSPRAT